MSDVVRPVHNFQFARKHRGLPKDLPKQKSGPNDDRHLPAEDIYKSVEAITLRLRIRSARRLLGEEAIISEPNNLEYLREEAEAVFGRIEQRELLRQTAPLARIVTCDTGAHR